MNNNFLKNNILYYDLQISNLSNLPQRLSFSEIRGSEILNNPTEFYVAPSRFSIASVKIPIMKALVNLAQTDVNQLAYSFTMSYNGINYQQFVEFIPENKLITAPVLVNSLNLSNPYYFIYSYQHFINLLNTALTSCFIGLKNAVGSTFTFTNSNIYFDFDITSAIPNLVADLTQYDDNISSGRITLYCNEYLSTLLSSFMLYTYEYNEPNGKHAQLRIFGLPNDSNVMNFDTYNAYSMYSAYSVVNLWNCISCIRITTTLPIASSIISPPKLIFSDSNNLNNTQNSNLTSAILTDFAINDIYGYVSGGSIDYTATGLLRFVEMFSEHPIYAITLDFYFVLKNGIEIPIYLEPNTSSNIKLNFRNKILGLSS